MELKSTKPLEKLLAYNMFSGELLADSPKWNIKAGTKMVFIIEKMRLMNGYQIYSMLEYSPFHTHITKLEDVLKKITPIKLLKIVKQGDFLVKKWTEWES